MVLALMSSKKTDETRLHEAIAAIYDAARAEDLWADALGKTAGAFRSHSATLFSRDLRTMGGTARSTVGDEETAKEYFSVWRNNNPFVMRRVRWVPGVVETDEQMLDRGLLVRSPYYNEYMRRFDVDRVLHLAIDTRAGIHHSLSISRADSVGEYDRADVRRARILIPHFQRAIAIAADLERSQVIRAASVYSLEGNSRGAFLLDRERRILYANRAALGMADTADAFRIRDNRLAIGDPADAARLASLLAAACDPTSPSHARSGVARLRRTSGARDYIVTVSALDRRPQLFAEMAPSAMALVCDPDARPKGLTEKLQALYALTPTEARLAERIAFGETPAEAAEALRIKLSTIRWHLASIYRKTDSSGQAALIRIVAALG